MVNLSFEYRNSFDRFYYKGDHLIFAIPQGRDRKNFTHTAGEITKNLQNFKNFQSPPLEVKNDTFCIKEDFLVCLQAKDSVEGV